MSKPIDYDAPRRPAVEIDDDSLDEFKARSTAAQSPRVDPDEAEVSVSFELAGADLSGTDLSGEDLTVAVVPMQSDEFRCPRCFLVHHRSQLVTTKDGQGVCQECA